MAEILRRSRRDALPENTKYADTGCPLFSACLECPLEECQYDSASGVAGARRKARNDALVSAAREEGASASDLASMFGLSRRTVFRVLRQYQRGG
ncbi:MAG TPA: helix-turn-helix domain-containing protein [Dehalococcoidia bacterium]|nr:helix-turn-helix domain-containing protein [Dehalococcoidia bacterium]